MSIAQNVQKIYEQNVEKAIYKQNISCYYVHEQIVRINSDGGEQLKSLQDIRKDRGLVGGYVAKRLGIGQSLFSLYECGRRPFPVKHFPTLSKLYGVSLETIVKAAGVQHGSKSASNHARAGKAPGV